MENFLGTVITMIFAVVGTAALPFIKNGIDTLKRERLQFLVNAAVFAAEQLIKGEKAGAERHKLVRGLLESLNVDADSDYVNALVEAEVFKLSSGKE